MSMSTVERTSLAWPRSGLKRIAVLVGVVCLTQSWLANAARAEAVPILPFDPATQLANSPGPGQYFGFTDVNINGTYGWSFQVLQPVDVVGLGWYDDGANGLAHDHAVGLSASTPLAGPSPTYALNLISTMIPAGTSATLLGSYRVEMNAPVTLPPGTYYVTGWDYISNPDPLKFAGASVPTDPRIAAMPNPLSGAYSGANQMLLAPGAWLGPMVFVTPAPEPATFVLAGMALALLAGQRYRWRKSR